MPSFLRLAPLAALAAAGLGGCAPSLIQASAKGNTMRALTLIDKGADPDARGYRSALAGPKDATSPLLEAAKGGHWETVRALLRRGANPNVRDDYQKTPLIWAAELGRLGVVVELLAAKADIQARDHAGLTALMAAAAKGHEDIAGHLLKAGALADGRDDAGMTALMHATLGGHAASARALVAGGADAGLKDSSGRTALAIAKRKRFDDLKELLQNAEAARLPGATRPAAAAAGAPAAPAKEVDHPSYKNPEDPDRFAIVVGIERYASLPEAPYAERDARAMSEHLAAMGVAERNLIHLAGDRAPLTGIKKYLEEWLPRNATSGSRVFLYFSGHGAPDPETGEAYLVPWDGDPQFLKTTAYPVKKLYASLSRLKAREVVVALDSCFSGSGGRSVLPKGMRPLVTKVAVPAAPERGFAVLTAAASDQITGSLPERGHGLFTYYLLEGLNGGAAEDGRVTVSGLYDYLKPRVQDAARRENREQSPVLAGSAGELILAVH